MALRFITYSGMTIPMLGGRTRAATFLKARRREGRIVSTLLPGGEWEVSEPDDSIVIDDYYGYLVLGNAPLTERET